MNFQDYFDLNQLYASYASAVSSGQWELWPEFFTEECSYRLQPRENYERGFPLATLSFESKGMLKDRVYGIRETLRSLVWSHGSGSPVPRSVMPAMLRLRPYHRPHPRRPVPCRTCPPSPPQLRLRRSCSNLLHR